MCGKVTKFCTTKNAPKTDFKNRASRSIWYENTTVRYCAWTMHNLSCSKLPLSCVTMRARGKHLLSVIFVCIVYNEITNITNFPCLKLVSDLVTLLSRSLARGYSDFSKELLETYWTRHGYRSRSSPANLQEDRRSASLSAASWFVLIPVRIPLIVELSLVS